MSAKTNNEIRQMIEEMQDRVNLAAKRLTAIENGEMDEQQGFWAVSANALMVKLDAQKLDDAATERMHKARVEREGRTFLGMM